MDKKKIFWVLLTIVIAVIILVIVINLVLKKDEINEGKFRVSDAILSSSVELANKTNKNSVWSIDLSQKNKLSLLITPATGAKIDRIYLSDITTNRGNITFSQLNNENKIKIESMPKSLELEYTVDENNQILIELIALKENILKDWTIPSEMKQIVYDGRMVSKAGLTLKDIQFRLQFRLNILENTGKISTMKVDMLLPNEELIVNGADVRRLSLSDFRFKVK